MAEMIQAQHALSVQTEGKGLYEVTQDVVSWVSDQGIETGLLTVFCRHTSASLTIQENANPDVLHDLKNFSENVVPEDPLLYRHTTEGPDDMPAHIRGALTDVSLSIPVQRSRPALGTWQGIFCSNTAHDLTRDNWCFIFKGCELAPNATQILGLNKYPRDFWMSFFQPSVNLRNDFFYLSSGHIVSKINA
jgi:secondary thiamine-phosphate synthase enzyme